METDFTVLEQLVTTWQRRAEALRAGGPGTSASLARAEAYDACAAQLAQALAGLRSPNAPVQDGESLELFG